MGTRTARLLLHAVFITEFEDTSTDEDTARGAERQRTGGGRGEEGTAPVCIHRVQNTDKRRAVISGKSSSTRSHRAPAVNMEETASQRGGGGGGVIMK